MRILWLSDVYFPRIGGVSTSIRSFRAELPHFGIETALIAPDYNGRESLMDEDVIRIPSRRAPFSPEDRIMDRSGRDKTLAMLAPSRMHFDLIHIQTPFRAHSAGIELARELGIPAIASYHTLWEEYAEHYLPLAPRWLSRFTARALTRYQARQVSAIVAPSEAIARKLESYRIRVPIHAIPTGLPAERFVRGNGERFRERFRIPPKIRLMLYVGRVASEKNLPFLFSVLSEMRRPCGGHADGDVELVIAGDGPMLDRFKAMSAVLGLARHVHWCGYLDHDTALRDAYAAASVCVTASRTETQGLALLEALAQTVPVVALKSPGLEWLASCPGVRLVTEGAIPQGNVGLFVREVREILLSRQIAAERAAHGRAWARLYEARWMAGRLAAVYRKTVERFANRKGSV